MKNRIVIWGEDEKENKVLITLELLDRANKVEIKVFSQDLATEEFYKLLMGDWKDGKDIEMPEGFSLIERSLSMTESLLPDELKTDKSDILTRAQAEWHFTVLSGKLYEMYKSELDEYKEKVDSLSEYSEDVWNEMKGFWDKVSGQVRERNMFRDHAATLKERTNNLFDKLKALRKEMKKEFDIKSSEIASKLNEELDEIEAKIQSGLALNPVFNELKDLQNKFFKASINRKDKDSIWSRVDSLFKIVKEKQFGDKGKQRKKEGSRVQSRLDGLLKAIQRMQTSISYDKKDIEFQNSKISTTDGQLEQQIRQAKLVMIQERLNSKQSKLDDMLKTKTELLTAIEKEKQKEHQKSLELEKRKVQEEVKSKIAEEIKSNKEDLKDQTEKLEKAAEEIKLSKAKKSPSKKEEIKPSIVDNIIDSVSDIASDISETISDVIENVEETLDKIVSDIREEE